jgi:hypothetical protein
MALAVKSNWRFVFRYLSLKDQFPDYRNKIKNPGMLDFRCFIGLISDKLSERAHKVMSRAELRNERYEAVVTFVMKKLLKGKKLDAAKRQADFEATVLKEIVDYELRANKAASWNFRNGGFERISDDFLLFGEYLSNYESQHLKQLCARYGDFFLSAADQEKIQQLKQEERENAKLDRVKSHIRPIWVFFVALCHALQEGEDWGLTATDAFWLGLIDEVLGIPDLPTLRLTVESQPEKAEAAKAAD